MDGKYTSIKQTIDEIDLTGVVKFSDLSTKGGTTIHGGNISTGTITATQIASNTITGDEIKAGTITSDHISTKGISVDKITASSSDPIITLFNSCAIDATNFMNQGIGQAIRLKWNDSNYWFIKNGKQSAYINGTERFYIDGAGAYFDGVKLSNVNHTHNYSPSSHLHAVLSRGDSNDSCKVIVEYANSTGMYTLRKHTSSGMDLGTTSHRWYNVYSVNNLNTSDINYKKNINYIQEGNELEIINNNEVVTEKDMYNFIKEDFKLASFEYVEDKPIENVSLDEKIENKQIGFIANDIYDTKVGKTFTYNLEGGLMYSPAGYTSVLVGALKEEIRLRDNQIEELVKRIEILESKL